MNLHRQFLTQNDCYRAGGTIRPAGVMLHSTGANNPRLSRYVGPDDGRLGQPSGRHWNQSAVWACVHAFIGQLADGSIATYQTLPWTMRGWHCGRSGNDTHIGIEICEDALTDPAYFQAVYREAVELTVYLCREFDLDPLEPGVVLDHREGHARGIASNHADVAHWFGLHGKTMDDFRADVARELRKDDTMTQEQFDAMMDNYLARRGELPGSDWAAAPILAAKARGITDGTRPQGFVTREEAATMAMAAAKAAKEMVTTAIAKALQP